MLRKQSYLEKQERKQKALLAAGLVSDRFPGVASISFRLTYYQKTSVPVLMTRTVNFFPPNYACFHLDCIRDECTNGGFDLLPVVAGLVKGRKTSAKGKLFCNGKHPALHEGHASIAYEVNIEYVKRSR
jgi:hypothetical protein